MIGGMPNTPVERTPADSENPFQPPPPPAPPVGPSVPPFSRVGDILGRAFNGYSQQWSAWPVPLLVCGLVAVASYAACFFPFFLAQGPLICGLYWCAFRNLRGWPVDTGSLGRGWQLFWPAASSNIALMLLEAVPGLVMSVVMLAVLVFSGVLELPVPPRGQPNPADVFPVMLRLMFIWMPVAFLGMAWTFWLYTRTMFVMPLVADRGYDFFAALHASWDATRYRFWERLLLVVLARIIGTIGVNLCYVGLLFTLPFQFLIIAAAYEDEFGIQGLSSRAVLPGAAGESPFQTVADAAERSSAGGGDSPVVDG